MSGFEASHGWLHWWKERYGLSYKKMHREATDADLESAEKWVSDILPHLTQGWSSESIYNCDETGLFYRAVPDGTYALKREKVSGGKKAKNCSTVLLCCNSEGSDILPQLVIGTSKNPRCFKNVQQLPLPYEANSTAWMTADLFCKWLIGIDNEMRKKKRSILIFADSAPCHVPQHLPKLTNVKVEFLPPNTTCVIQPLDQGIIKTMKTYYRKQLLSNLIAKLENDSEKPLTEFIKTVTVLDALHFLKAAWQKVTPVCVQNCFRKVGLNLGAPTQSSLEETGNDNALDCSSLGITEEEFDHFVTMDNNIDCYGDLTDEEIISDIRGDSTSIDVAKEESEDQDLQVPRNSDVMQALSTIRYFLDAKGLVQVLEGFYPIEEQVWKFMAASRCRQTVLTEFFSTIVSIKVFSCCSFN